jgi:hypothetical protein
VFSFKRYFVPTRWPILAPHTVWRVAAMFLMAAFAIVARGCGYDFGSMAAYAGYFLAFVALPGLVVLYGLRRGPISLAVVVALGVPTGFAIEIFSYLGMAAGGLKEYYRFLPLVWLGAAAALWSQRRERPVRVFVSGAHSGIALGLAVAFFGLIFVAASQMFAESPLPSDISRLGLPREPGGGDQTQLAAR